MERSSQNLGKVVVAMSGGVDSSVATGLLVEQGYEVTGLMLRLWSEDSAGGANRCCAPDAVAMARRVAATFGVTFYVIDARDPFYNTVVHSFIEGYSRGITPNPCFTCNRQMRWGLLLDRARALGAGFLATGHYARVGSGRDGMFHLFRGKDPGKDQSYVLSQLTQEQLSHTIFPLGELTKPQVRDLAAGFGLPVASRPDSQDLCFVADRDYRSFLRRQAPQIARPGPILNRRDEELGEHQGLAFYTIGQRKGIRVSGPKALYVVAKDMVRNALIVGEAEELGTERFTAGPVSWVTGSAPEPVFEAQVKIRYRAICVPAVVALQERDVVEITAVEPLRDVTPGQVAVLYRGDECLGGGVIQG